MGAMLPVLACYFAEHGTNVPIEHKQWIDQWFWRSAFSERYALVSDIDKWQLMQRRFGELIDGKIELPNYPLTMTKDDIRKMKINRDFIWRGPKCDFVPPGARQTETFGHWSRYLLAEGSLQRL